ncbi:HAMP domain-containing sensor histidine kinase [Sphaerobacter sp.]|uniref:sensor histidine kinase n=1 Tax=Sphaerobacter sp. TaxID=2099654 RepID=UPI001D8F104E|nr:HAMP domain-containing sensor histidine kinase [Sphaerobacter sp.]MBX5443893.1 HAMP domain-containing histidine kinase [Sphaerobacter sp.]
MDSGSGERARAAGSEARGAVWETSPAGGAPTRRRTVSRWLIGVLAIASLLVALALDLTVMPRGRVVSLLYALPVLVAARWLSPRAVGAVGAAAVCVAVISGAAQGLPVAVWITDVLGLLPIVGAAVLLARQRVALLHDARVIEEVNRRLTDAQQQLQLFIAAVTHELRQPLTTIVGYAQGLQRRAPPGLAEQDRRALDAIIEAVWRTRRISTDLHDAARLGVGQFTLQPAPVDLVAVVLEVVEAQAVSGGQHRLHLDAPEELTGCWDRERITQVVANLIDNAVKYSPDGGEVRTSLRQVGESAILTISDQGPGLSDDQQTRLFQPFSRVGETTLVGSGLGLFIAKGIVESHGGRIWVDSAPNRGSTFTVRLPLRSADCQPAG